jgi:general secretion pathway protein A
VVLNPQLSVVEFLATICEELDIEVRHNRGSVKALTDALNRHLLAAHAAGRRTILVVDEAQNLAPAVLEQVRLLTNLETAKQKLLQIILIGQPELRELLARTDLRQLAQRITARYHLEPLSREETASYIEHRLQVAGALGEVFDSGAKKEVFRLSQGVPRLINVICDRALLGAYAKEMRPVRARLVRQAAAEVKGELEHPRWIRPTAIAASIAAVALIATGSWYLVQQQATSTPPATPPPQAVAAAQEPTAGELPAEPAPEEAAEPEPEPEPGLLEQLQLAEELTSTDFALASLFESWGLEYRSGGRDGCDQAADAGLACVYERASWAGLTQMDRPAILTLVDDAGNNHAVVLKAVRGDHAELSIGGVNVTHPIADITAAWFGDFMLLWRPPTGEVTTLAVGSRGPAVTWLRDSLRAIDERYASAAPEYEVFDADLARIVRAFQRDHRLDVDGVAGQQTQIIINSLLAVEGTPQLSSPLLALD